MTAPRRYEKSLPDLPAVAVPDWVLLRRLEELFRPYVPTKSADAYWLFTARDSRGEYSARTVDELRQEVEEQEEPPSEVRLYVDDAGSSAQPGRPWYELGVTLGSDASRGLLYSTDEPMVNHVATRLRELFGQAARRAKTAESVRAQNGTRPESQQPPPSASFWLRHLTTVIVGTMSTVAGGVILYLIFGR
jgi:hypothetical protein